jgi:hypothetical protein
MTRASSSAVPVPRFERPDAAAEDDGHPSVGDRDRDSTGVRASGTMVGCGPFGGVMSTLHQQPLWDDPPEDVLPPRPLIYLVLFLAAAAAVVVTILEPLAGIALAATFAVMGLVVRSLVARRPGSPV